MGWRNTPGAECLEAPAAQTARRRKTRFPQDPVKSTVTHIISSRTNPRFRGHDNSQRPSTRQSSRSGRQPGEWILAPGLPGRAKRSSLRQLPTSPNSRSEPKKLIRIRGRRGSMWQLRSQRSAGILDARICLPQQLLGAEVCGAECAKPGSGGRRFGSPARGPSLQRTAVGRVLTAR